MSKMRFITALSFGALSIVAAACSGADVDSDAQDATSIPFAEDSPEARAVLAVANDRSLDVVVYDDVVGLHKKAAHNLIAHRSGETESLDDDNLFDDLGELWTVKYCKSSCFKDLLDYAKETGVFNDNGGNENISVVFSPQDSESTHLAKIAEWIDNEADESIDIAMYSYSHSGPVRAALERAVNRGVQVRFLANTDLANSTSKGGGLEEMGIDVRRITKTMHHKFAIIDGPRDNDTLDRAATAHLISGSANWSSSAGTIYDENTLFMTGYQELTLRMQRDFDYLWGGSKDKVYADFEWDQTKADITDDLIASVEEENNHVFFTSKNFKVSSSGSWSYLGTTEVTNNLTSAILGASDSIEIATGHFVSDAIVQSVADAIATNPELDVRIVIDCQEANKYSGNIGALKTQIESLGGGIAYKCTTYRWHYKYAKQMHHKYVILDGDELWTGSLNFSNNSEQNVMENMMRFSGSEHAGLIAQYQDNLDMVLGYGSDNEYGDLVEDIETGSSIPLTWSDAITMDRAEWDSLKDTIRANCPAVVTWADNPVPGAKTYDALFNQQPQWFAYCKRNGYPWPNVPENMRVD
jgi:phosphatidylserine/phosphatidylglycerophosphate/cardiolipin synthase-like enzyme